MILLNGVSGFDGPAKETDGVYFKKMCYSFIQSLGGSVIACKEPDATRNYYEVETRILGEDLYILLNSTYPFIAFASSVDLNAFEFVDNKQLANAFSPYYRVVHSNELNERLVLNRNKGKLVIGNENELNDAELSAIDYWKPETVGEAVFNYWD